MKKSPKAVWPSRSEHIDGKFEYNKELFQLIALISKQKNLWKYFQVQLNKNTKQSVSSRN